MGEPDLESRIKLLQAVDFFSPFSNDELGEMLRSGIIKRFVTHEYIIKENAVDYSFFIILKGKADIIKENLMKRRKFKIATLGKGECFGEMAMLLDGHRSASVMAQTECFVFATDQTAILAASLETQLKFMRQLARSMAIKLKNQATTLVETF